MEMPSTSVIDEVTFMISKSKRGRIMLLYKNNKFYVGSRNDQKLTTRWRCIKKTCSAKLYTNQYVQLIYNEKTEMFMIHNHEPYSPSVIQKQIINVKCKDLATDQPLTLPRSIVQDELSNSEVARNLCLNKKDVKRIVKNVYDARKKKALKDADRLPGIVFEDKATNNSANVNRKNG